MGACANQNKTKKIKKTKQNIFDLILTWFLRTPRQVEKTKKVKKKWTK